MHHVSIKQCQWAMISIFLVLSLFENIKLRGLVYMTKKVCDKRKKKLIGPTMFLLFKKAIDLQPWVWHHLMPLVFVLKNFFGVHGFFYQLNY